MVALREARRHAAMMHKDIYMLTLVVLVICTQLSYDHTMRAIIRLVYNTLLRRSLQY